jgi:diguanylate cyclase (GGDEF)-like protein/PAS domain S-box-containing protein
VEEMSEGQEQMSSILGSLDSAVVVVDSKLCVLEATSRVRDLFGKQPGEIRGRPLGEVVPVLGRAERAEMLREVLETGSPRTEDGVRLSRAGSGSLILQVRCVPYRRSGRITGAVIVAADVTEEYHLRESLKRRNEELETISRIGSKLNSTLDLEEISTTLARTIRQFHPDEAVSILLPVGSRDGSEGDSEYFRAAATSGFPGEYDPLGSRLRVFGSPSDSDSEDVWERQGIISVAARTGQPENVEDVTQDSRYLEVLPTTRSEMVVPMVVRDKVVGIIDVQSSIPGRFSADNVRRITTLANHAATAVENAHLHAKVWEMAQRDRLTGLRNLRYFEDRLKEELDRASRYDSPFSLIMMDIDDFKHYNDSFGHPMGNVLLRTVSRAIASALREVDILVRYGGEEFVCILPMTGQREAAEIAERIRRKVLEANSEIPHASEQPRGCVSISLGVSSFLTDVRKRDRLLEVADERMYAAKRAGKNRVCSPALGNCPPGS